MTGQSLTGYTELKELGSGGFGRVMLARHDATATMVAVKYLRADLRDDPEFSALFRGEAELLGSLSDPCVVQLYEYLEWPGGAAIVMELVDGTNLREVLVRHPRASAEAAVYVLYGSLLGLAAAHAQGVVHRDYKPENVLINETGASKLTDFGISARSGRQGVSAGSLRYAPPEQFDGSPATPAGDVYAATATFYECLAGQPPFTGDTREALMWQHRSAPVPFEPIPEPLRPVIARGLAKDPAYRPADAGALAVTLREVAAAAYGPGWEQRGRSQLGQAAVLLAALWPSAGAAAPPGFTAEQVQLARGHGSPARPLSRAGQHQQHVQHLQHEEHLQAQHAAHLQHEGHLQGLRSAGQQGAGKLGAKTAQRASRAASRVPAGMAVVAAAAVAAAAGTIAASSHPASDAGSSPASGARQVVAVALDPIRPGDYPVNREISDSTPWLLTLTDIRVLASGQAEFMITYDNTASVQQQLTCSDEAAQQPATLTFSNGGTESQVADYCSQHGDPASFYVAAGQALQSYVIFPQASKLGQSFTLNWPAGSLSGQVAGLQLPSSS